MGGSRVSDPELSKGNYFSPTLMEVETNNNLFHEEVFGPIMTVTKVKDQEEAIKIANDSQYGLGATIVSKNISKANELAVKIQSNL